MMRLALPACALLGCLLSILPALSSEIGRGNLDEEVPGPYRPPLKARPLQRNEFDLSDQVDQRGGSHEMEASSRQTPEPEGTRQSRSNDPLPPSPEMAGLRDRIRTVLRMYITQHLNTRDHNPWELMHAIVAYGVDTQVRVGSPRGEPVTAIGWLCYNRRSNGQRLFHLAGGTLETPIGPGIQGHEGQFLAMLAQSHVKSDYPIRVGGTTMTVDDLIEHEKATCLARTELTFKLIGLMHYLDSDAVWESRSGRKWSIQRLIKEELAQPIRGVTCGGSHRLMGLSYAVQKRAQRGEPIVGEFRRAFTYIREYHRYTFQLQNRDGSFSTEWFRGRSNRPDIERRLKTTGHILEWLAFSLPDDALQEPRVVQAVNLLTDMLLSNPGREWEIGPLGHALRALVLYDRRVFHGTRDGYRPGKSENNRANIAARKEARTNTKPQPVTQ